MKSVLIPKILAVSISSSVSAEEKTSAYWIGHGYDLINQQKYNEAIEAYDKALELNESYMAAFAGRSEALLHIGKYSESLQNSNKALSLNPGYSRAWVCRGVALLGLGDLNGSKEAYDRAIEIDPCCSVAWNNKAWLAYKQGRYQEAAHYSHKAIAQLRHQLGAALDTKAVTLSKLGESDEALKYIDEALEMIPMDSIVWTHKGDILKALGNGTGSEAAYAKAKEMPEQSMDL